ncbi:MAG TPA: DUF4386 domain-containing protein [Solirubrobacteraceae bacterium]|nr:DUF4386 domain-containing protein [Solirubrobacteraceae bacterium]
MESSRRAALSAGVLFIVATVTDVIGTQLSSPIVNGSGYLAKLQGNATQVTAGALLEFIAAGSCAGIAIALFPVLRKWSVGLAVGSVVFRSIEAAMYSVAAGALLTVLAVSNEFTSSGLVNRASYQILGDAILAVRQQTTLAGVMAFTVGAILYYYVFYRSQLIPRWLSGWGIVGIVLLMGASMLALFNHVPMTNYTVLALPIAVQEMVLALWLIFKGFSSPASQPAEAAERPGVRERVGMVGD